jgi:hypothetical protein
MKNRFILVVLLSIPTLASAQLSVEYTGGYGAYTQMGDLRKLIDTKLQTTILELPNAKIVANFPNYFTHTFGLNYVYKREEFGFQITRMSTGGKIAYSDYSGKYTNKLILSAVRIGTRYRYDYIDFTVKGKQNLTLFWELSPGVIVSNLKHSIYEEYATQTVTEDDDGNYSSVTFSLLPQIGVKTNYGRFGFHLLAGYDLEFGGKLDNGYKTRISWMGLRTGIGFSYTFPPRKEKKKEKDEDKD